MESATSTPTHERNEVAEDASPAAVDTDELIARALDDLDDVSAPTSPAPSSTAPKPRKPPEAKTVQGPTRGGERHLLGSFWNQARILAQKPGWIAVGASASTVLLLWASLLVGLVDSASRGGLVLVVALVQGWLVYALLASKRGAEAPGRTGSLESSPASALEDPPFAHVLREVDRIATFLESVLDRHAFRIRDELRRRSSQLEELRREYETQRRQWTLRATRDVEDEPGPSAEASDRPEGHDEHASPVPGYEKGTSPLSRASLARMERVAAELLEHLKITAQAIALADGDAVEDGAVEDGAVEDGAVEDGAVEDGADPAATGAGGGAGSPVGPQIEAIELLVRQLVELANLRTGASWSGASNVELTELLEDVRTELREAARLRGVRISVRVADEAREALLDGGLLRRAIRELVGNAVIHSGKGGRVSLSATVDREDESEPPWLRIRVRDSGRGVFKKDRERIFRPWEVGSRLRESLTGCGLGLGLALARSCARRLGGDLTLQTHRGKGSTFTLSVPLMYSEARAQTGRHQG